MKSFDFFFHFRHLAEANDVAQLRNRSTADGVADNLFYFVFYLVPMWHRRNSISFFRFCLFCFFFHRNGFFFFFDGVVCCFCFFFAYFFFYPLRTVLAQLWQRRDIVPFFGSVPSFVPGFLPSFFFLISFVDSKNKSAD